MSTKLLKAGSDKWLMEKRAISAYDLRMQGQPRRYLQRAAVGLIAALAIGLIVVTICNAMLVLTGTIASGWVWNRESPVQMLVAALPFIILTACGVSARRAWITGLCLTAALWSFYGWAVTHYRGGGADIGLGILMLLSPLPITSLSLLSLAGARTRRGS